MACDVHHQQTLSKEEMCRKEATTSSAHYLGAVYCVSLLPSRLYLSLLERTVAPGYLEETLQQHGSCATAALPCLSAPWTCQAGAGATKFPYPSISFLHPLTVGPSTVLLTALVKNFRRKEDARHAEEDGSNWAAGSVPHQPASWMGRQSLALAKAKTRPHFTAKQSLFVWLVLPEQSSTLTMSFLLLSLCRVTSSMLSLTPGSFACL